MDLKSLKSFRVLIVVLMAFAVLWGLFYFVAKKEKKLVSENDDFFRIEIDIDTRSGNDMQRDDFIINDNFSGENLESNSSKETEVMEKNQKKSEETKMTQQEGFDDKVSSKLVSWGFSVSSGRKIDTIVLHSSYNALGGDEYDLDSLIDEYKKYGVSPHYLIDRNGKIYQLVEDRNIAYHAGVSQVPDGRSDVNDFSVGIEIMNTKSDKYEDKQYEAVNWLIDNLQENYNIKYVLGHNDIAPGRKTDPWNFIWDKIKK